MVAISRGGRQNALKSKIILHSMFINQASCECTKHKNIANRQEDLLKNFGLKHVLEIFEQKLISGGLIRAWRVGKIFKN